MAESKSTSKKSTTPAAAKSAAPATATPAAKGVATPVPAHSSTDTNVLAIVSLIAGIAGLTVVPFLGSITAIITGHIGRKELREKGQKGDGLAVAGLITGYIGIGLTVLFFIAFIFIAVAAIATGSAGYYRM